MTSESSSNVGNDDTLLTQREVTELLSVTARTIQRWLANGDFPPPIKLSNRIIRWRRDDIDSWLTCRVAPAKKRMATV